MPGGSVATPVPEGLHPGAPGPPCWLFLSSWWHLGFRRCLVNCRPGSGDEQGLGGEARCWPQLTLAPSLCRDVLGGHPCPGPRWALQEPVSFPSCWPYRGLCEQEQAAAGACGADPDAQAPEITRADALMPHLRG